MIYSDNPNDLGITVIGGVTGLGKTTQSELEQKMEDVKKSLREKKPLIMDEYWNTQKSDLIDDLREKHPPFKMGNEN